MPVGCVTHRFIIIVLIVICLFGFFHCTASSYSDVAETLSFSNELRVQDFSYCKWRSSERSMLNFKDREVPLALIFSIDHNLSPRKLHSVLSMYHALACLLPSKSDYLYAAVSHLPKNPKLFFGKLMDLEKLHQSFDYAGETFVELRKAKVDPCYIVDQTILLINDWLSKPFFFQKVIKHIIYVNDYNNQCTVSNYFDKIYYKDGKVHRWFINQITLNVPNILYSKYDLITDSDLTARLKNSMNRSVFDGAHLQLSSSISQQNHKLFNETVLKKSLTEFLREIVLESVLADATFSMEMPENWIKFNMNDFKKHSRQIFSIDLMKSWTWVLGLLRIMFFIVGAFILLISTCALCGFACMLSSIIRDDYYHRRQERQREQELRNLEERFREAGVDVRLNPFLNHSGQDHDDNNDAITAIERVSEMENTQDSSIQNDDQFLVTALSHEHTAPDDKDVEKENEKENLAEASITLCSDVKNRDEFHTALNS